MKRRRGLHPGGWGWHGIHESKAPTVWEGVGGPMDTPVSQNCIECLL